MIFGRSRLLAEGSLIRTPHSFDNNPRPAVDSRPDRIIRTKNGIVYLATHVLIQVVHYPTQGA